MNQVQIGPKRGKCDAFIQPGLNIHSDQPMNYWPIIIKNTGKGRVYIQCFFKVRNYLFINICMLNYETIVRTDFIHF